MKQYSTLIIKKTNKNNTASKEIFDVKKILSKPCNKANIKTAKGRKISSTLWIKRQLSDPFVIFAKMEGYLSRAAYKLLEINKKFKIFNKTFREKNKDNSIKYKIILDLGCAPGSWMQVMIKHKFITKNDVLIGVDLLKLTLDINKKLHPNIFFINGDFEDKNIIKEILAIMKQFNAKNVDIILSDMAENSTGESTTDRLKNERLVESVFNFANKKLSPNGIVVCKTIKGSDNKDFILHLQEKYQTIKRFKPSSSRSNSSEIYLYCESNE